MKKKFVVLLFGACLATPAFAQNPTVSLACKPKTAVSEKLPVGWDFLLDVVRVQGDMQKFEIETRVEKTFEDRRETIKTAFSLRPSEQNGETLFLDPLYPQPEGYDSGLSFASIIFHFGDLDAPPTAGPVPPGTFPSDASLVLLASSRGTPGGPLRLRTLQIDLSCDTTILY